MLKAPKNKMIDKDTPSVKNKEIEEPKAWIFPSSDGSPATKVEASSIEEAQEKYAKLKNS